MTFPSNIRLTLYPLAAAIIFSCISPQASAQLSTQTQVRQNPVMEVRDRTVGNHVDIWAYPLTVTECTFDLECTAQNMRLDRSVPYTIEIRTPPQNLRKPICVLNADIVDPNDRYRYDYKYSWRIGLRGGRHDDSYVYALPFAAGTAHKVMQGYGEKFSHQVGSDGENAIDFEMPDGTQVLAARDGIVVAIKDDSTEGGNDKQRYEKCANYVTVKHVDGSYADYVHLTAGSCTVRLGQVVRTGQVLGQSGHSGFASAPHLHFIVFIPVSGSHRRSYRTRFATASGLVCDPPRGQILEAQPR